jgi:hypothetical protein
VGEAQQPSQRCQFAVDRAWRERCSASRLEFPATLNVFFNRRLIDAVDPPDANSSLASSAASFDL